MYSCHQQSDARARGFTLVELTVAVVFMAVVVAFFAPLLHAVQRSWTVRAANSETLAQARAFVHHFHLHVSQASNVSAVSDSATAQGYLQFVDSEGSEVRYDVDADGNIHFGPLGARADLAGPVRSMRLSCYDGNDGTTPITDCNAIRLVHVDATFTDASGTGLDLTLSTSVYLRSGAVGDEDQADEDKGGFRPEVAMKDRIDLWDHAELVGKVKAERLSVGGQIHLDLDAGFD